MEKNGNPKFSVLMASYNSAQYIAEAIGSVIGQTWRNWELIIADDASTDGTLGVVEPYLKDPRIKLIKRSRNQGSGAAKRTCAENATGEIFGILDSDDKLAPHALEKMAGQYAADSELGLCYSQFYECDENMAVRKLNSWVGESDPRVTNLKDPKIMHFCTFRRSAYEKTQGYDPVINRADDKDIVYKLEEVTKLKFVNEPLYYYRIHSRGIASLGKNSELARIMDLYAKYKAFVRRQKIALPNYTRKEMAVLMYEGFIRCFITLDINRLPWFITRAVKLNPNIFMLFPVLIDGLKRKRKKHDNQNLK